MSLCLDNKSVAVVIIFTKHISKSFNPFIGFILRIHFAHKGADVVAFSRKMFG